MTSPALHLEYSAWATQALLDAAQSLSPEELERNLGASHGGVLDTLRHIYYADRIWLTRLSGETRAFKDQPEPSLAELRQSWPALLIRFRGRIADLGPAQLQTAISYSDLKGNTHHTPIWQVVAHAVNHATLHRGQVMAMFRQLGHVPPATDLIFFYRQL